MGPGQITTPFEIHARAFADDQGGKTAILVIQIGPMPNDKELLVKVQGEVRDAVAKMFNATVVNLGRMQ